MNINLDWADFKLIVSNKAALRYVDRDTFYRLKFADFECAVMKDAGADQTDFETNYKPLANAPVLNDIAAFASKKYGAKSLFTRTTGKAHAVAVGANTLDYTITYAACKINGLEIINAEIGDYVDLQVVHPTYGVLSQFGYSTYLAKDFYCRTSNYDADLVSGLILRIIYNSISAKTIYTNYLLHEVV